MADQSGAMARRAQASPAGQSCMIDDAISQLHQDDSLPHHIGVPAMHALLLAKHFHSKGLKVPDHLKDPPPTPQQSPDNNGQEGATEMPGDADEGDNGD